MSQFEYITVFQMGIQIIISLITLYVDYIKK